ncbi:MAG TPA: hypothetical protein VMD97_05160 [Candidatus Aquilonibacter sp.]|nr:hypothetical protein [Candidatus Aquilonibacter sp.]
MQQALPPGTPRSWIDAAAKNGIAIIQDDSHPMRYRMRKIDRKGDTTREVIESAQGNVARLVARDGKPLTAEEDDAERQRLNDILKSPQDYLKHEERGSGARNYAVQLVKLMPSAMIYTYAPDQPQPPGSKSRQIVIDFRPDPKFHPPTMISEVLTGLAGRVWIDSRTQTMTRIEGHVLHAVNFGWGFVARIYPGGTIELEQTLVDGKRWAYSRLDEDLTIREVMLHTVSDRTKMTAWDFHLLPQPMSFQDAVHALLAMPVRPQ